LGPKPQFDGTLAATQVDLDRLLGLPEATRRRPLVAVNFAATVDGRAAIDGGRDRQ
jgi:hypothetical protein